MTDLEREIQEKREEIDYLHAMWYCEQQSCKCYKAKHRILSLLESQLKELQKGMKG